MQIGEYELRNISTVTVGQTTVIPVPPVGTIHEIELTYTEAGTPAAQADLEAGLNRISVFINNRLQWQLTPQQLLDWNELWGDTFAAGKIPLRMYPRSASANSKTLLPWGMGNVQDMRIEVEVDAGATTPGLTAVVRRESAEPPIGAIIKLRDRLVDITSTGEKTENGFGQQGDALIALDAISTDIDRFRLDMDNKPRIDTTVASHHNSINASPNLGVVTGHSTLLFPYKGDIVTDSLPLLRQGGDKPRFDMRFDMGSANPFNMVTALLGAPD